MKAIIAILLVATLAISGCLSSDGDKETNSSSTSSSSHAAEYPENFMPFGDGHDHADPTAHKFLWNYELSGHDALLGNQLMASGVHALERSGDILVGAVYGANIAGVNGGLQIWDISTPESPVALGSVTIPSYVGGDRSIDITPDGQFVVFGLEPLTCFGQVNPVPLEAFLVDISDPNLPMIVDTLVVTGTSIGSPSNVAPTLGVHSVRLFNYNGTDVAYLFGDAYVIDRSGLLGASLVRTPEADIGNGHDLYIRETTWGTIWAFAANGNDDFAVWDVTDFMAPKVIGRFELPDGQKQVYYLHTADAFFPDGKAVIVLTSEDWQDHASLMWIFDGTELRTVTEGEIVMEPKFVWSNPFNATAIGTSFSLHNPRFSDDGILSLSSYHAGIMQLDFSKPSYRFDPKLIAYAVYSDDTVPLFEDPVADAVETNLCGLGLTIDAPTYMDVELGDNGILYVADVWTGLYTFKPTAGHPIYG